MSKPSTDEIVSRDPQIESERLEAIRRLGLLEPSFDSTYDCILRLLVALVPNSGAAFSVLGRDVEFLKAVHGVPIREAPREIALCDFTIRQSAPLIVENYTTDPRFTGHAGHGFPGMPSMYVGFPVRAPNGVAVGSLCIFRQQPGALSESQLDSMSDLRHMLERTLELRSLSDTDALTGIFNRRHLDRELIEPQPEALARMLPLAVLVVDIDGFKLYNDYYGHIAGDICLRHVAATIHDQLVPGVDTLARMGGEEFACLLPGRSLADATATAERICAAVRARNQPHAGVARGRVTVSVGGVVAKSEKDVAAGGAAVLSQADQALYEAKHKGRDRHEIVEMQ